MTAAGGPEPLTDWELYLVRSMRVDLAEKDLPCNEWTVGAYLLGMRWGMEREAVNQLIAECCDCYE